MLTKRMAAGDYATTKFNRLADVWAQTIDRLVTPYPEKYAKARSAYVRSGLIPNVWMGCTVENQDWANRRLPFLSLIPAARLFVSCEPLTGAINLRCIEGSLPGTTMDLLSGSTFSRGGVPGIPCRPLDWVITGGESGDGARPAPSEWYRRLRDDCRDTGRSFFFKQWGEFAPTPYFEASPTGGHTVYPAGDLPTPEELITAGPAAGLKRKQLRVVNLNPDGSDAVFNPDGTFTGRYCGEAHGRYGKKLAGRVLDGRTWEEIPNSVL